MYLILYNILIIIKYQFIHSNINHIFILEYLHFIVNAYSLQIKEKVIHKQKIILPHFVKSFPLPFFYHSLRNGKA